VRLAGRQLVEVAGWAIEVTRLTPAAPSAAAVVVAVVVVVVVAVVVVVMVVVVVAVRWKKVEHRGLLVSVRVMRGR